MPKYTPPPSERGEQCQGTIFPEIGHVDRSGWFAWRHLLEEVEEIDWEVRVWN